MQHDQDYHSIYMTIAMTKYGCLVKDATGLFFSWGFHKTVSLPQMGARSISGFQQR